MHTHAEFHSCAYWEGGSVGRRGFIILEQRLYTFTERTGQIDALAHSWAATAGHHVGKLLGWNQSVCMYVWREKEEGKALDWQLYHGMERKESRNGLVERYVSWILLYT